LINGVRIGSATTGTVDFSSIPLTGVERIELVKGSRAAIYGADAIGGVINIITSSNRGESTKGQASFGFGSDQYVQATGSLYTSFGKDSWLKLGINRESADGFDVTDENYTPSQPDDDGFERQDISLEIGSQVTNHWLVRMNGFYRNATNEYDGYEDYDSSFNSYLSPTEEQVDLYNLALQLEYQRDNYRASWTVASNQDKSEHGKGEIPGSKLVTDRTAVNWLNSYQFNKDLILQAGIEYSKDSVEDSNLWNTYNWEYQSYDSSYRENYAAFITSMIDLDKLTIEASIRSDDNSVYGTYNTWQLGASYTVNDQYRVFTSGGTAFQAPTYNELYWPDYGNPDLEPEESLNYELGIEAYFDFADFRVIGFSNTIDNLKNYQGKNVELANSDAKIKGIELGASFETWSLVHDLSLDLLDTENKVNVASYGSPDDIQTRNLARRADESFKWLVSYDYNKWQFDLAYLYQSDRYDDAKNTEKLDSYSLVDLVLAYQINEQWTVQGKVNNVFDTKYQTAYSYNTQRRAYYLNTSYQF
jgi:vitamin B12 transporter